jgi:hypothetical protein
MAPPAAQRIEGISATLARAGAAPAGKEVLVDLPIAIHLVKVVLALTIGVALGLFGASISAFLPALGACLSAG